MASIRVRRVDGAPVVAIRVWLPGGSSAESEPGQAWVAGRMLLEGTGKRDWRRIADDAETRGAGIVADAGLEAQGLAIDALADDFEAALEWAAEMMLDPTFPEERCRWVVRQTLGELEQLADHPDVRTSWAFSRQLYGSAARGRPLLGTPAGLARVGADDCRRFHAGCLERGAIVTIAGDLDEARAERSAAALFGGLVDTRPRADDAPPAVPSVDPGARQHVELVDAEQAHWFGGAITAGRRSPDYWTLALLGVLLGSGGLSGRISNRVRERDGLAYGCSVSTVGGAGRGPGCFTVAVGASPERIDEVTEAVSSELEDLVRGGVGQQEMEEARDYLLGREPFQRETARQWANLLAQSQLFGLPIEDAAWVESRWRRVTAADVADAARRYLAPERLRVTIGSPPVPQG